MLSATQLRRQTVLNSWKSLPPIFDPLLEIWLKKLTTLFDILAKLPSSPASFGGIQDLDGAAAHGEWCKCWHCTHLREMKKAEEHGPQSFEPRGDFDITIRGPQS